MTFTLKPVKGREFVNRTRLLEEMVAELKELNIAEFYFCRMTVSYPKRGVRLNLAVTFGIILGKY